MSRSNRPEEYTHDASGQRQDDSGSEAPRRGLLVTKSERRKSSTESATVNLSRKPPFFKIRTSGAEANDDVTREHESREERDSRPPGHKTKKDKKKTSQDSVTYDSKSRSLTYSRTDTTVTKVSRSREAHGE